MLLATLFFSCGKLPEVKEETRDVQIPLTFSALTDESDTKSITNQTIPVFGKSADYNFRIYALLTSSPFSPGGGDGEDYFYFQNGANVEYDEICAYNETADGWKPGITSGKTYYWPMAGYLTFQAYWPLDLAGVSHNWTNGVSFTDYVNPEPGSQIDLLYTGLIKDRQRSQYTSDVQYEEISGDLAPYKGVDIIFKHALSLIEVQASSGLGSNSPIKYFIERVELRNIYQKGSFSSGIGSGSSDIGSWSGWDNSGNYTLFSDPLNPYEVPGDDLPAVSVHPDKILMLLPQALNRHATFDKHQDACLYIAYHKSIGSTEYVTIPLTGSWVPGQKYIYKLNFSDNIEFEAVIQSWGGPTTGSYTITEI